MLTASLEKDVSHGSLTLNPNGSFTYTPAAGYIGMDSFDYTCTNTGSNSSSATATINISESATSIADIGINNAAASLIQAGLNGGQLTIRYTLVKSAPVDISLYTLQGKIVNILRKAGIAGENKASVPIQISGGVYVIRIKTSGGVATKHIPLSPSI